MNPAYSATEAVKQFKPLSKRETQIITLLADGHTKQTIAEHLLITKHTVASHVTHIFQKLDVANAPGAVGKAFRFGIIALD